MRCGLSYVMIASELCLLAGVAGRYRAPVSSERGRARPNRTAGRGVGRCRGRGRQAHQRGDGLLATHEGCPYGRPTAPAPLDSCLRRNDAAGGQGRHPPRARHLGGQPRGLPLRPPCPTAPAPSRVDPCLRRDVQPDAAGGHPLARELGLRGQPRGLPLRTPHGPSAPLDSCLRRNDAKGCPYGRPTPLPLWIPAFAGTTRGC